MSTHDRIEAGVRALISGGVLRNAAVAAQLRIPVVDLQVLNLLAVADRPVTPSRLAALAGIPRPSITRIVDRLATAGYVRRRASDVDGRSVVLEVDAAALDGVRRQYAPQYEALARAVDTFTPAEAEVVARFLALVTAREG